MFRLPPAMALSAYQTYQILAPVATHWRPATCAEVDCPDYINGWRLRVEGLEPQMLHAARMCGRKYLEVRLDEGETWLIFEAGQPCFRASQHRIRVEREERFLIRGGDHRGNPSGLRTEVSCGTWTDDFGEHQQGLAEQFERG